MAFARSVPCKTTRQQAALQAKRQDCRRDARENRKVFSKGGGRALLRDDIDVVRVHKSHIYVDSVKNVALFRGHPVVSPSIERVTAMLDETGRLTRLFETARSFLG